MNRREFLSKTSAGILSLSLAGCFNARRNAAGHKKPNFVIIFTDDQGYADVGCYGAEGFQTPHLDQMAREGMRFTDFHVSQAVCSASRASLLTGCYSNRVSILGALMPWDTNGLHPDEQTIAEILKPAGYTAGIFGKWHLGHHRPFLPLQHGFDEYAGLPYSNDMWPVDYDGTPFAEKQSAKSPGKAEYPPLPLMEGNKKVDEIGTLSDQDRLTTLYTERAVAFIEKNKNRPFFLYMPHSMPHVPLGVSEKFRGKSQQGLYGDVIMEIDWSVGQILAALKSSGLDENTLVIFASDNGPWLNFGNHAGSAKPLREGKGAMWEGGARVPCVMRWPGHIEKGLTCSKMAATIDILPTMAAIADVRLPEKKIDGVDISPLLAGDEKANPRKQYYYYYGEALQAVREGKWKLVFPHSYRTYNGVKPGKDGWPGPYAKGQTGLALYDLEKDVSESVNVADGHPGVVARLEKLARRARHELGDALTNQQGADVRPCGQVEGEESR
ncbi:MAG: sulfatase [Planctomycetales bacterium]|nr:sulfatase [Planctomycetales bacterium]